MISSKKALFAALVTVLVSASPAHSQMTGSRLGKNAGAEDATAVMELMIDCVGKRSPGYARKVMGTMPGSRIERELIFGNEGDLGMCMEDTRRQLVLPNNAELTLSARQFRLGLAKTMARDSVRSIDGASLAEAPAWTSSRYVRDENDAAVQDSLQLSLFYFGDCVVQAAPLASVELLLEGPETDKGKIAIGKLAPHLGPCLTDGAELKLTGEVLVAALAEPIYHRAAALSSE